MMLMSCTDNLEFGKMSKDVLSLEAFSTELQTKTAGEDAYKENIINTVEWFFFKDAEGTQLLYQVHSDGAHLELQTPETGNYSDLRYKSYLYAVANITLPTAPEGGWTLEKLLEIPVSTNFTKTAKDDEGNDGQVLDIANLNFIMDTYDEKSGEYLFELVPEAVNDDRKITVPLSRLAVKISTMIKIKKEVTTVDSFGNEETWTPVLSETDFDVYMVDALKAGYLSGEPVRRAEATDKHITGSYFTYARNLVEVKEVKNAAGGETGDSGEGGETGGTGETGEDEEDDDYYVWQTVNPFYTYPQTWNGEDNGEPFIKVIFPWMSDVKGSSEFHYKIVLPEPEYIAADPEDESSTAQVKFTLSRNCWYQVTATIAVLGGTENDYVLVDQVEYSVADWADPAWTAGSGLSTPIYFLVPKKEFDVYSSDSFEIPFYCESNVEAYFTYITFEDYSQTPTVTREWSYTDKLTSVTPSYTIRVNNQNVTKTENQYRVTVDNTKKVVVFNHSLVGNYVLRDVKLVIAKTGTSKATEVIIHHHPAIELKKQGGGDVFVNGHFARLSSNPGFGTTVTITGQGTFYHSRNGWSNGDRIINYNHPDNGSRTNRRGMGYYNYGTITDGDNVDSTISTDWYTTDITVTAFNSTNDTYVLKETTSTSNFNNLTEQSYSYMIADPRVKVSSVTGYSNWALDSYLKGEIATQWNNIFDDDTDNWTNPGDILISSQAVVDRVKIAPHFLVSSALNANTGLTWDQVIKRAATYQEAGYPAGRWRVPTEAEMAFIVSRQKDGTIPNLYATNNTTYWCGSGRVFRVNTGGDIEVRNKADNDNMSVRFVYDLWYWGEDTMTTNQYHANQHIESN